MPRHAPGLLEGWRSAIALHARLLFKQKLLLWAGLLNCGLWPASGRATFLAIYCGCVTELV